MKQKFTMTQEQLNTILKACKPIPLIMLQCGMPPSQQEMANDAWAALGRKMGFRHMTVEPISGQDQRVFMAEPEEAGREQS